VESPSSSPSISTSQTPIANVSIVRTGKGGKGKQYGSAVAFAVIAVAVIAVAIIAVIAIAVAACCSCALFEMLGKKRRKRRRQVDDEELTLGLEEAKVVL
jgi:Flp pilus assembly protein TadB